MTRRWFNVGVVKIPHGDRDVAHSVLGDRPDDTLFQDIIGADTPDDDEQFPVGSNCTYRAALTDEEAEQFRAASNCRYVVEDVVVTNSLCAPSTLPGWRVRDTLGYWPSAPTDLPGTTPRVAVLDTGTTSAMRSYMGITMAARGVYAPTAPPVNESYTGSNHGSLCASNAVSPGGQLVDVVVLDYDNTTGTDSMTDSGAAQGITYAVAQGAQVVSCSWGWTSTPMPALLDALLAAASSSAVFFFASGNEGGASMRYPARYTYERGDLPHVKTVGGWDMSRHWRWASASYHAQMTGVAPSIMVRGVMPTGVETEWQGTSAAAPCVANMDARLIRSGVTARQAADALAATCVDKGMGAQQGGGLFDLQRAAEYLGIPVANVEAHRQQFSVEAR
jgi:hypothetical protein